MVAISLCVLLLATYCYSVPVTPRLNVTTPEYEFTTGHTMVDHNNKINMHLMTDAESTGVPSLHPRTAMGSDSSEYTTSVPSGEHIGHAPRALNKSATVDPAEATFLRNFNKFQFTTMETKHQFQKKAIGSTATDSEEAREPESKREFSEKDSAEQAEESEAKREFSEKDSAEQAEESEAKRAFSGNDLETVTTYSRLSGSPSTTYQPIRFAESRENLQQQPTTTYQPMNSTEIRENSRQQPTTTYQSVHFAESRENSREQPSTTYRSIQAIENSREQPSTTYRSIQAVENSREQPSTTYRSIPAVEKSWEQPSTTYRSFQAVQNSQEQPSTTYRSFQAAQNSQEQPSTTYRSIPAVENSREQPSSVDSFGRNTGLLRKQQSKTVQMTRPVSQSNEEFSTTSSQILRQRPIVTKTETILPIKVTETKYFVSKQPVAEAVKSDN